MSLLKVNRKISSTLHLSEDQTRALHGLAIRCLEESYNNESGFSVNAEEYSLLGELVKDIESSGILL